MYDFERELERQHSQQGFRLYGLTPLPLPRPPMRAYVRAYAPAAFLLLLGASIAGVVIALACFYQALLASLVGDIMVGVVWVAVLAIGLRVVQKIGALRRSRQRRTSPPARVHDAFPSASHDYSRSRSPLLYPKDHFYSYDPLNERPSEQLQPDQRSRF
jgi:hypothetical protein